jgi:uncharacterized protein YbjT (DUF2867 family)
MSLVPLITVFGATGAQGGGLARALLQAADRPFRVRAVTRRPGSASARALARQGAEIVAADLDDAASVEHAMRGAHGVFAVTNFWEHRSPERELQQAEHLAEAARRADVRHVIWSTLEDTRRFVEPDGSVMPLLDGGYNVPHFDAKGEADTFFTGRCLPLTRLLTSFYWDNLIHFGLQPQRDAQGRLALRLPMGDAALPGIASADIGACAAALFRQGEAAIGRRVGIAGEHLSGAQMAARLSYALGEPVRHDALDPTDYVRLGLAGGAEMANMFQFKRDFSDEYRTVRDVDATRALHPGLMRFDDFLARHAAQIPIAPVPAAERLAA